MHAPLIAPFAIALYLLAAGFLASSLRQDEATPTRVPMTFAAVAVLMHAALVLEAHRGALDLHFFAALSLVACVVSALTLVVNLTRPIAALGVIVFPLSAVLFAIDVYLAPPTFPQVLDWQIKLHATFALLAYSVLSIAVVLALLLALQERALRNRHFGAVLRALPPLTLTETLLFRLIATGFALLSLTLLSGILFVENLFAQHLIHKTVLSIIAWVVFGVLLLGRRLRGWRGRRAVNLALAGYVLLLLSFFGTKFVLELVLHRVG
ncbi:MAG: cytochrome c biogenesis protein CcsA [Dokdonella sp.]|uniref:cytochrome C assembly family protein n=1 Tax=Dokdonella sp. TaxID=2291710 RepID=UPI0025BCC665|nr:cytochrome c biogenesis protein CcsA [Dokdonella sp.]MBZ0221805.1 cytochrome c biogenesis protein CcsA [Dokdonella sp.]